MFNQFNVEDKWYTYTDKIMSVSGELFVENDVDISGNLEVQGDVSFNSNVDISGNLIVDGFFGGNYYGPMGSIRTIIFDDIPVYSSNYYYLGAITSHFPSHIYILGEGTNTNAGSVFTITRHHNKSPHISGILGENYYAYKFFYEMIDKSSSYYLWFRPSLSYNNYINIKVTVKIQSFSYNFLSPPTDPSYADCKYGLIERNVENTTHLGLGTHLPNSSTTTAISDDRLKFNETTISNGLSVINKLNPLYYDMSSEFNKQDKTYKRSGFVAQEVYEIDDLKHAINVGNDSIPWSIHYNDIFTYNIAATKELDTIVQNQQTTINELNTKISNLEAENISLKEDNTLLKQENTLIKSKLNELLSEAGKETI